MALALLAMLTLAPTFMAVFSAARSADVCSPDVVHAHLGGLEAMRDIHHRYGAQWGRGAWPHNDTRTSLHLAAMYLNYREATEDATIMLHIAAIATLSVESLYFNSLQFQHFETWAVRAIDVLSVVLPAALVVGAIAASAFKDSAGLHFGVALIWLGCVLVN